MRRDSRLSAALHLLVHMEHSEAPMTSNELSVVMNSNPAVIRRLLAGIRDAGFVRSAKGHGGGWSLDCDTSRVSLHDIYEALGSPPLFAIGHRSESPSCLVEQAVNASMQRAFEEAEAALLRRLREVSLKRLLGDVSGRCIANRRGGAQGAACVKRRLRRRS